MQLNKKSSKVLITGSSGTGKSSFFNDYVLNSPHGWKFIYDPEGEFQIRNPKLSHFVSLDLNDIPDFIENKKPLYIFDPSDMGDLESAFNAFSEVVFAVCENLEGEKLFASDELQLSNAVSMMPEGFSSVLEVGRRRGLDSVFIVQAPNLAHNRLRNQTTNVVTFRQKTLPAMKCLVNEFGLDEVEDEIRLLQDGQFIDCDLRTGQMQKGDYFKKKIDKIVRCKQLADSL